MTPHIKMGLYIQNGEIVISSKRI